MNQIKCKKCQSICIIKNGKVRQKQRYKCKACSYNFIQGDGRVDPKTAIKRAYVVIMYSLGKSSYGFLAKLFKVSKTTIQNWLEYESDILSDPIIDDNIKEIEFDEMWHFIDSKKINVGLSKLLIEPKIRLSDGLQAVVIYLHSEDFMKKYSI